MATLLSRLVFDDGPSGENVECRQLPETDSAAKGRLLMPKPAAVFGTNRFVVSGEDDTSLSLDFSCCLAPSAFVAARSAPLVPLYVLMTTLGVATGLPNARVAPRRAAC